MDATMKPEASIIRDVETPEAESPPNSSIDADSVPDGGMQAWLVAGGAAFITFSTLGFTNSFGIVPLSSIFGDHRLTVYGSQVSFNSTTQLINFVMNHLIILPGSDLSGFS